MMTHSFIGMLLLVFCVRNNKKAKKHNRRVTCDDKLSLKRVKEKRARSHASTSTVVACHFTSTVLLVSIAINSAARHNTTELFFFFFFLQIYIYNICMGDCISIFKNRYFIVHCHWDCLLILSPPCSECQPVLLWYMSCWPTFYKAFTNF